MVALWTFTLKVEGSNLIFWNFKFFLWCYFHLYTFYRLKAPGSNPLDNIKWVGGISHYDSLPSLLYLWLSMFRGFEPRSHNSAQKTITNVYVFHRFENQCPPGCYHWAGLGTAFFSVLNVPFFSVLLKNATFFCILFLSFWRLMKPKRTMHSFAFFS